MSDRQRGPGRKKTRVWIVLLIVIVVILGIMIAVNQSGSKQEPSTEQSGENKSVAEITKKPETEEEKENQESSEEADDGLEFPYLLDDDQLQVDSLFQYSGIKEIKLPESVTTVGDSVFAWTKLETLYLPESLTSIESSFLTCVDSDKLTIYVKKGSYADEHFADFAYKTNVEKAYY